VIAISILFASACAVLAAGHGKAGLWNISTSMTMPGMQVPQVPPEVAAMMRQRGVAMPGMGQPITTQVCMTEADVAAERLPDLGEKSMNCTTKVTSSTPTAMTADMVCHGRMEGTGHVQMTRQGAEHYSGTFNFKGVMNGQPHEMTNTFKGDWVKADCSTVKPIPHG